jgi:hypothetical protein
MQRPLDIAEWTAQRDGRLVHIHASLTGNSVKLFECVETASGIGRDCVEMPSDVLRAIVARLDSAIHDDRQREMGL